MDLKVLPAAHLPAAAHLERARATSSRDAEPALVFAGNFQNGVCSSRAVFYDKENIARIINDRLLSFPAG